MESKFNSLYNKIISESSISNNLSNILEESKKVFRLNMFESLIDQINQLENNEWITVNKEQLKKIYQFDPKIPWIKNKQLIIFKRKYH